MDEKHECDGMNAIAFDINRICLMITKTKQTHTAQNTKSRLYLGFY